MKEKKLFSRNLIFTPKTARLNFRKISSQEKISSLKVYCVLIWKNENFFQENDRKICVKNLSNYKATRD